MMDSIPWCPPSPPEARTRIAPGFNSTSSATTSSDSSGTFQKFKAPTTACPLRFMKVTGFSASQRRPPSRHEATRAGTRAWASKVAPAAPARASTQRKPALCRVPPYFTPGFPSPTTNRVVITGVLPTLALQAQWRQLSEGKRLSFHSQCPRNPSSTRPALTCS